MTRPVHPQIREAFNAGYLSGPAETVPHLWSSDCFEAWEAGRAMAGYSLCVESLIRKSRAYCFARLSDGREASARVCYGKDGAYQVEVNPPSRSFPDPHTALRAIVSGVPS